ncbi:hypothetical protein DH2020_043005 [Rehmannia glutinosa]|uniref:Uncharacterized protein n=1 Tax=Rehmannia glutinosa TaxID=99300 RepID=A0ABR0UKU2_REHGL
MMAEKWEEMLKEVSELKQRVSGKEVVRRGIPFSASVMADELPTSFHSLTYVYDGTTDPWENLCRFENSSLLHRYSDGVKCRVILTTLSQSSQQWFNPFPADSIGSFGELARPFCISEPLRDYVKKFTTAAWEVLSANQEILTSALTQGLKEGNFVRSLVQRPARDFYNLLSRAEKYVNLEKAQKGKKEESRDKRKDRPRYSERRHQNVSGASEAIREGKGSAGAGKEDYPLKGTINMMVEAPTDGDSNRSRKAHARVEIRLVIEVGTVEEPIISFGVEDRRGITLAHNDPLVITATITNFEVARIMVDTSSSVNVLFYEAYLRMGLEIEVKPVDTTVFGFGGRVMEPIGHVTLSVTIGEQPRHKMRMVSFFVVDSYSTYNVIIGRPALNAFQAIVSTFHMKLKFVMEDGVGEVLGDQQVARKCYVEAVRKGE